MVGMPRAVSGWLAVGAAAALAAGCGSTAGYDRAGDVARGMADVKAELKEAVGQVNRLVATAKGFETVAKQGDLKAHYARFDEAVQLVETQAARIRVRADDLRARRDAYLEAWTTELAAAKNESVQAASDARREAVTVAFDEVEQVARGVRASYELFMDDAKAVRTALANDLTPAGVASVADVIQALEGDGASVVKGVDAIVASMDRAGRELPAP